MGRPQKNSPSIPLAPAVTDLSSLTKNPPSHPHENPSHRKQFLERSLSKSDREIAALQRLHVTIRKAKGIIVGRYGEMALLDIGRGVVRVDGRGKILIVDAGGKAKEDKGNVVNGEKKRRREEEEEEEEGGGGSGTESDEESESDGSEGGVLSKRSRTNRDDDDGDGDGDGDGDEDMVAEKSDVDHNEDQDENDDTEEEEDGEIKEKEESLQGSQTDDDDEDTEEEEDGEIKETQESAEEMQTDNDQDDTEEEEDGEINEEDGEINEEDGEINEEDGEINEEDGEINEEDGEVSEEDGEVSEEDGEINEEINEEESVKETQPDTEDKDEEMKDQDEENKIPEEQTPAQPNDTLKSTATPIPTPIPSAVSSQPKPHPYLHCPTFHSLARDYLLRLRLRRKLLNRLARRLMRVSHSMDGRNDKVIEPPPPKYGDQMIELKKVMQKGKKEGEGDGADVDEWIVKRQIFEKEYKEKEAAWLRIKERKRKLEEAKGEEVGDGRKETEGLDRGAMKGEDVKEDGVGVLSEDVKVEVNEKMDDGTNTKESEANDVTEGEDGDAKDACTNMEEVGSADIKMEVTPGEVKETNDVEMCTEETNDGIDTVKKDSNDANVKEDPQKSDDAKMEVCEPEQTPSAAIENSNLNATCTSMGNVEGSNELSAATATEGKVEDEPLDGTMSGASCRSDVVPIDDTTIDPLLLDADHQADLDIVATHDRDYNKILTKFNNNASNNQGKLIPALSLQELSKLDRTEEDFADKSCRMVNAAVVNMSAKQKLMEWKRWQNDILARVPDQPSFAELGMERRVFFEKERIEMARKKDLKVARRKAREAAGETVESGDEVEEKEKGEGGDEEQEKEKEQEQENKGKETEGSGKEEDAAKKDKKQESNISSDDESSVSACPPPPTTKTKPFLLQPLPSFYLQDAKRTHHIHVELLNSAISEHHRAVVTKATNEYNSTFRRSSDLVNRQGKLEMERQKAAYQHRVRSSRLTKEHASNVSVAKGVWQRRKEAFDAEAKAMAGRVRLGQKMQMAYRRSKAGMSRSEAIAAANMDERDIARRALAGAVDRVVVREEERECAMGTNYLHHSSRMAPADGVRAAVATTLAHCVDVVVGRVERGWVRDFSIDSVLLDRNLNAGVNAMASARPFPKFIPPPGPDLEGIVVNAKNETLKEVEARIQLELRDIAKKLAQAEADRAKAWNRLMSSKAEFEGQSGRRPQSSGGRTATGRGGKAGAVMDPAKMPPPPLKTIPSSASGRGPPAGAKKYNMSANVSTSSSKYASGSRATVPVSQSKYSADKVKARIYSDGSVMPVSAPKKTKDGLYMRPAGRQRKGMDWDAVVGKWVPAGTATKTS